MTAVDQLFRLYEPDECTGHKDYPPEWHETLKHEVRRRAANRCVRCGHPYVCGESAMHEPDASGHLANWSTCDEECTHVGAARYLATDGTVHFIDDGEPLGPWRSMVAAHGGRLDARARILTVHHLDGVKGNCRWWNLAALCQRCHLTIQGKVVMDRRWHHEHSGWFRPYVAGYYAFVYLGEDLDEAEADARMDELLALEVRQGTLA